MDGGEVAARERPDARSRPSADNVCAELKRCRLGAANLRCDLHLRVSFLVEDDVAQRVATAIAQPYDVIFHADERRAGSRAPDDLKASARTLQFCP